MEDQSSFYKVHPKTCAPKDYWRQVARTRNGQPVGEDQIQMIVDSILAGLEVRSDDLLLDLCCGNGALSDRIFSHCRGGLGVDFSPPLVEVAKRDFEARGQRVYLLQDVLEFVQTTSDTTRFTKALCYGSFMFLPLAAAEGLLRGLERRFSNLELVMIGNLPDKAKLHDFFDPGAYRPGVENDPTAPIGIWRTEAEFTEFALRCGWRCSISRLPPPYYGAHYRYDALLRRVDG